MNVYKIPDSLAPQYKGCGIAIATANGGEVTSLLYVRRLVPDSPDTVEAIPALEGNEKLASYIRELPDALGPAMVGLVSCWEFIER